MTASSWSSPSHQPLSELGLSFPVLTLNLKLSDLRGFTLWIVCEVPEQPSVLDLGLYCPGEEMANRANERISEGECARKGGWQEPAADSSQPSVGHCDETRLASDAGGQGDLPPCSGCCLDFSQQLSIHAGLNSGAKELTTGPSSMQFCLLFKFMFIPHHKS